MSPPCRRYIRAALTVWLALLTLAALVNWIVDPFCAYGGAGGAFAGFKPAYDRPELKAELVASLQPTTLILGSSRALVFDPLWSEWGSSPTFNLGLAGASQREVAAAFRYASGTGRVARVLLCIEYSQFSDALNDEPFARSRFAESFCTWTYHLQNLLSCDGLNASRQTLRNYVVDRVTPYTPLGAVRGGRFDLAGTAHHRFLATLREGVKIGARRRLATHLEALRAIARGCREQSIELDVVMSPVHCLYLESLAWQGQRDDYRRWLGEVVETVESETLGEAEVWDFAGYNRYTTEPAPLTDESPEPVYYQEASHFTGKLARKVFERVYRVPGADAAFGEELNPGEMPTHLMARDVERAAWLAGQPASLALLRVALPRVVAAAPSPVRRKQ